MERKLTIDEASSAATIQRAIDDMAVAGGRLLLPAIDLVLDRGLELRTGVELVGRGAETVLRKGPGRIYPLSGYHNYGMCDVPLESAAGLAVGMTVSVHDRRTHGGFYETFATITWVDGSWVGLDHGIEADYLSGESPSLTTVYPLVFAHRARDVALRDVVLEGSRRDDARNMGGCRGGALYFARCRGVEVSGVRQRDYHGEGLSFQMCRDVRIVDSRFDGNSGNGMHPGAGSTNVVFSGCSAEGNERSGFFFCVRANHVTVRDCSFRANALGMSIGTRDCHNLIEGCVFAANAGAGVRVREAPRPTEVHSCRIRGCRLDGNGAEGGAQIEITADAHDLILEGNAIDGLGKGAGVRVAATASGIHLDGNRFSGCEPDVDAAPGAVTEARPVIECGAGDWPEGVYRHLATA